MSEYDEDFSKTSSLRRSTSDEMGSRFIPLNSRGVNNNVDSIVDVSPSRRVADNVGRANNNVASPPHDRGTSSVNPKSKRPRPKPSPALLEAKKLAIAKARENNLSDTQLQPEIAIVMTDHLQRARDAKYLTRKSTGVVYDSKMMQHECLWDPNYPEKPERFSCIIERCEKLGLLDRCKKLIPRLGSVEEVLTLHPREHIEKLKSICSEENLDEVEEFCAKYDAVYVHPSTYELSLLSVGCTVDLCNAVLDGKIQNGMAIIRPPGHHAMKAEYCGYCYFNNVAIAAKLALDQGRAKKVLIVDFDVHHGQATQQMFYEDPRVLYFSTHRFEHGNFWPNLEESNFHFIGSSNGIGFNCNVPLNKTGLGNSDFLTIWHQLLLPLAYEGEMELTPQCCSHLLWSLMGLASGKVAVILEGGYCLKSLAEGAALTLRALLGDPCPYIPKIENPSPVIVDSILNSMYMLNPYWNLLAKQRTVGEELEVSMKRSGILHEPEVRYEWNEPKPTRFPTRDCYFVQSTELLAALDRKLDRLILSADLSIARSRVGIVYDDVMLKHRNMAEPGHPERPERISNIFACHVDNGLIERCLRLNAREATVDELRLVHTEEHIRIMSGTRRMTSSDMQKLKSKFNSIFFNNSTYESALVAAGSVLEVVDSVLSSMCQSGVAIVRPPGHHAEEDYPHGFCIFNNVAVAAKHAVVNHGLKRVLIVDWDVHHGNGIQRIFEDDPRVLYISIHRYDHGSFFPCSEDANYDMVGKGQGVGYNVNIPWNSRGMGDTEYLTVFTSIILPIAYEFNPELVLVSAGFDAARGDPLGGCTITPEGYGHFTHLLSSLANGKIILALEGGYNLTSIAYSMSMCTKALLGDPLPPLTLSEKIHLGALDSISDVLEVQSKFWTVLKPFAVYLPTREAIVKPGCYPKVEDDIVRGIAELELRNNN